MTIETGKLDWKDKERLLSGDANDEVKLIRENGTSFYGRGFTANARDRTWEFAKGVNGTYIHDDDDEDTGGTDKVEAAAETAVTEE
jgi:hypothetical protein